MNSLNRQLINKQRRFRFGARNSSFANAWQRGLSLVELMIAVALAMILMLGALQIFLFSKNTYTNNQQLADVQENGRFALYSLARDIRNAGYLGQCMRATGSSGKVRNHILPNEEAIWSHNKGFFFGWGSATRPSFVPANSLQEGVFIQFASGGGQDYEPDPLNHAGNDSIKWANAGSNKSFLKQGEVGVVSDGSGCDIFINDSSDDELIKKDNTQSREWLHDYSSDDFEQLNLANVLYYVANDEEGVPTLYRALYSYGSTPALIANSARVIASGVTDLKFRYGITNNPASDHPAVDSYEEVSTASGWTEVGWERVISVEVSFSIHSTSVDAKKFSTVIGLRNRVL